MPFSFLASEAGRVHVCGHRGYSLRYPENTLPALAGGKAAGATTVEIDVVLTADGEPIVLHDLTLDRTTDGHGFAADLDLDRSASLDAGGALRPALRRHPRPDACRGARLGAARGHGRGARDQGGRTPRPRRRPGRRSCSPRPAPPTRSS